MTLRRDLAEPELVEEARSRGRRLARLFVLFAACVAIAIAILVATFEGLFALYEHRSDKVTGESERAGRAWARIHTGMTEDAVTDLAGNPSARHGSCWAWGEGWIFDAETVFEVCFDDRLVVSKSRSSSELVD
jgi:hypothetical protein